MWMFVQVAYGPGDLAKRRNRPFFFGIGKAGVGYSSSMCEAKTRDDHCKDDSLSIRLDKARFSMLYSAWYHTFACLWKYINLNT